MLSGQGIYILEPLQAGIFHHCENDRYCNDMHEVPFLGRNGCETLLPFSFKWQPNIATMFQDSSPKTDGRYLPILSPGISSVVSIKAMMFIYWRCKSVH
jgi:hypothetical protein